MAATLAAAFAALIAYNLTFTQFQGRYLFTALVPVCGAVRGRLVGLAAVAFAGGRWPECGVGAGSAQRLHVLARPGAGFRASNLG